MSAYITLSIAIIAEVIATSALKASDGFTRLLPSAIVVVGYAVAFYSLSLTLRFMPLGVAYGLWSAVGIILISLVGWLLFQQKLDWPAIVGLGLIVAGVLVVNLYSKTTHLTST